jgi:thiamine-monophosphate kinase
MITARAGVPSRESPAPMQTVSSLTESQLVERISRLLPPPPDWLAVGIGDDAAVLTAARNRLEVLTIDAIVEGVHFDRCFTPADAIGHRALAVNLSDLAAMGAEPRLGLLSLALPSDFLCADFDAMVAAFATLARRHAMHLVGGNLTRSPGPLMADVMAAGSVKRRQTLTRGGARPGDELYVTGALGAAAAGLNMLKEEVKDADGSRTARLSNVCTERYLYPEPRVRLGMLLGRNRAATACIDLSDGLGDGVRRLTDASQVGAVIDAGALPIEPCARDWFARRDADPVFAAIAGGDDYELLFAVRPRMRGRMMAAARHGGAPITRIGVCTEDRAVLLRTAGGNGPFPGGYTHFR